MATTLATIALNCAKQLGRANAAGTAIADLGPEIKAEIQQAIRNYNRKPFRLLETRLVTLTTVAGKTWYSTLTFSGDSVAGGVPIVGGSGTIYVGGGETATVSVDDVLKIDYMRETQSSLTAGMGAVPYTRFEQLQEGTSAGGLPTLYTRYAGQIGVYPTPSAVYTIQFSALMKATIPATDTSVSVWFDEANELIEAAACARVCLKYLRDRERAQEFEAIATGAQEVLWNEYHLKSKTGRLVPHD